MPAGPFNPFGIVFLALSGVIWFGWSVIPDIYAYHEEIAPITDAPFRGRCALGRVLDIMMLRMDK